MNALLDFTRQNIRVYISIYILLGVATIVLSVNHLVSAMYTDVGAWVIALCYIIVLPVFTYYSATYGVLRHAVVILFNIVSFLALSYYVGAYNPFVVLWALVLIVSYLYSGIFMFIGSSLLLVSGTTLVLLVYRQALGEQFLLYSSLSFVVVILTISLASAIVQLIVRMNIKTRRLVASKKAEEMQLNHLHTLLNSISDVVLTLNRYGRVTSENSAALSFFDTNQSLVGKNIDTILPLIDASNKPVSVRKLARNMRSTTRYEDVSVSFEETGTLRLSVQLSPVRGGFGDKETGCVVIVRDITRQKTLEDEKDEFISVTSHELRTPIAIAEGSLSNLVYMLNKDAKVEQVKASADAAHEQIMYLARMINDLSTLSRAERGVGDAPEEIDLNALLEDLFHRYQPEAEAKSLALNIDIQNLPTIWASRLYLEEILQNFVTNAIKYTKEGTVTMKGTAEGKKVHLSVVDSGIGISKTDQEKIFEKFFRSEDYRTRETGGTGLGLYVVRKLADKLNTKIEVSSRLNHGSTFGFTLSVGSPPPASVRDSQSDAVASD
ncbi:MAG: ATP-binding protein [Candidatus Saccharimonadales bacterium]